MPEYQGYAPSPQATDKQIREWFTAKYGYAPREIKRSPAAILAGPIGENNVKASG